MFKLMDKRIILILHSISLLIWAWASPWYSSRVDQTSYAPVSQHGRNKFQKYISANPYPAHDLQRNLAWFPQMLYECWLSVLWGVHWWPWHCFEGRWRGRTWLAWMTGKDDSHRWCRLVSPRWLSQGFQRTTSMMLLNGNSVINRKFFE